MKWYGRFNNIVQSDNFINTHADKLCFYSFSGWVIAFFRKSRIALSQEKHELLKKPLLSVGLSGLGIIALISCCWGYTFVPTLVWSYQNEKTTCREMPISDGFKLVIEDRRNGERDVNLDSYDGSNRFIWAITKFAIYNNYVIGETSFFEFDRDYFWINLDSKDVFNTRVQSDLEIMKESAFKESLSKQGISMLPDMISVETLCTNDGCTACKW
jgi:hypothetical protein